MLPAKSYHVFSCREAYDCTPDPAMADLAIRLYYITIEGSDAAGNIGRDQCKVIIIPRNMTIQDADAIVRKSSARYPVAATTDMGIMLEAKTNIILGYIHDSSQALFSKIDAVHSTTNRARDRGLMEADEDRDTTMLHENRPTSLNIKQRKKIEVELWMAGAAVVFVVGVGFGFVASNIKQRQKINVAELWMAVAAAGYTVGCVAFGFVAGVGAVFVFKILPK
jgi:hypothetical protein